MYVYTIYFILTLTLVIFILLSTLLEACCQALFLLPPGGDFKKKKKKLKLVNNLVEKASLLKRSRKILRSRFTQDKNLSTHNLTTNFLVNIPIYLEKS